jgi:hypothetical protein
MSQMASILGKTDEAIALKKRSEEIKKAFNDIYIDKNSHRTVRSGLKTGFGVHQTKKKEQVKRTRSSHRHSSFVCYPIGIGCF